MPEKYEAWTTFPCIKPINFCTMDIHVKVNPFMSSGLFYQSSLDQSVSNSCVSDYFLLLLCFTENPVVNANSVDPDQMPNSAASDLGLHCLPITLLGVSRGSEYSLD